MFEHHPSAADFESFLQSASRPGSAKRNERVIRHLLADCSACRKLLWTLGWDGVRLDRLLQLSSWDTLESGDQTSAAGNGYSYDRAFTGAEEAISAFLGSDQLLAQPLETLLAELTVLAAGDQVERVSRDSRFANPQLIRHLIDRSQAIRYQDPEKMLQLAELAHYAAEACTAAVTGGELRLADLRTQAWGQYGNALRVCGRLREAEAAYANAQRSRAAGTGDPALRAWLLEKVTSLHIFQGSFASALALSEEAGEIYRELGETHLLASTLVQSAIASLYAGDTESGVRKLNQAIPLIDHEEDPHLLLAACHNLVRAYIDLDRPEKALLLYSETRSLYQEFDDPLILLRAAWQEGQLLRDLGHLRAAEAALLRARKGFLERSLAYEVALVSLDLAAIYVRLRLLEELKETVATTVPIFRSLRVGRETLGALLQLQQVADQEQQALELIRLLNASLEPLSKQVQVKKRKSDE